MTISISFFISLEFAFALALLTGDCMSIKMSIKRLSAALALTLSAAVVSTAWSEPLSRAPEDNLIFASSTEPVGLDPALIDDTESGSMVANIYESLLRFKSGTTELEPSLAEKWEISPDGLTYTFYLRKGVKFHDGTPFNAEAVKFNFDRQSRENMTPQMASYAPFVFGSVRKTEVIDEYTVKVSLDKTLTPFLRNMAICYAAPIASPTALRKYNYSLMSNPVGTGPYRLVSWDKGQQLVLTTFDDYWGPKPDVQNVIYRIMKDTSARVVALKNGEVDIINGIDANVIEHIREGGGQIYENEGNNINYMLLNCRKGHPTADLEIREAIVQAINRPELVKSLYKGYATFADSYFPTFMTGYTPDAKVIGYDPAAARKTFAKKGTKKLRIFTYSNSRFYNTAGGQVLAEAVQSYLHKAGVKSEISVFDWATFRSKLLTDSWDICFMGWSGDNGDPDNFINIYSSTDPVSNQGLWINQEFISLINEAVHVPDGKVRTSMYERANDIMAEDAGVVPISHAKELAAHSPGISGRIYDMNVVYFKNISKKVVPAALPAPAADPSTAPASESADAATEAADGAAAEVEAAPAAGDAA